MHHSFCDWEKESCKCKVNGVLRLYFKISLLKEMSHHPGIQLFIGQLVEGVVDGDELFRVNRMIRIPIPISSLLQPSLRPSDRQLSICARLLLKPLQQLHWKHGLVEEVKGRKLLDVSKLKRMMLERLLFFIFGTCCDSSGLAECKCKRQKVETKFRLSELLSQLIKVKNYIGHYLMATATELWMKLQTIPLISKSVLKMVRCY